MGNENKKYFEQLKLDTLNYLKYGKKIAFKESHFDTKDPVSVNYKDSEQSNSFIKPVSQDVGTTMASDPILESITNLDPETLYRHKIEKCLKCSLSQGRKNVVFGDGNIKSSLFIVGEAPGRDEDLTSIPFVGRSGQLLTKMLEAVAIERKDVFITNMVKCRPPNNRDPLLEEINTCMPYLEWQLEYGKPQFILTLGRFSSGYFLNNFKSSLTSLRGVHEWEKNKNIRIIPTFHPAAVLRSPNKWKPIVWEDLKNLALLLKENGFYSDSQLQILKKNKVY